MTPSDVFIEVGIETPTNLGMDIELEAEAVPSGFRLPPNVNLEDDGFFGLSEDEAVRRLFDALSVMPRCNLVGSGEFKREFRRARVEDYIVVNLDVSEETASRLVKFALGSIAMQQYSGCFLSGDDGCYCIRVSDKQTYQKRYNLDRKCLDMLPVGNPRSGRQRHRKRIPTKTVNQEAPKNQYADIIRDASSRDYGPLLSRTTSGTEPTEDGMYMIGQLLAILDESEREYMSWNALCKTAEKLSGVNRIRIDELLDAATVYSNRVLDMYGAVITRDNGLKYRIERPN